MNIFYVDEDPAIAAQSLCDVHIRKMIIESCQMLSNCYTVLHLCVAPRTQKDTIRRYSHLGHPCSKWVRKSQDNYKWLLAHSQELAKEYHYRFGRNHFLENFINWMIKIPLLVLMGKILM